MSESSAIEWTEATWNGRFRPLLRCNNYRLLRLGLALLVGIGLGFAGGWLVFNSDDQQSKLTRAQAEQAVIRAGDGNYDAATCEATGAEFSCKALGGSYEDDDLHLASTVRVYERNGRAIVDDPNAP